MPIDLNKNKSIRNPFIIPGIAHLNVESQLNPNYSFDNFVEGDCNRLARSAGFAVSNNPGGTSFNPLLVYGGVGLGKTHLAHAIGIEVKNKFPNNLIIENKLLNQRCLFVKWCFISIEISYISVKLRNLKRIGRKKKDYFVLVFCFVCSFANKLTSIIR